MNNPQARKGCRILLIDANREVHQYFRKAFAAPGDCDSPCGRLEEAFFSQGAVEASEGLFEVDSAFQGQEGLAMVTRAIKEGRPYAMAFADVRLGGAIVEIGRADPKLQIVLCTADSDSSWKEIAKKLGASGNVVALKEPFDAFEIMQLTHAFTRKWDLARQAGQWTKKAGRGSIGESDFPYHALFNALAQGFVLSELVFDDEHEPSDLRVLDVNAVFEDLANLKRENLVGKMLRQILSNKYCGWIRACGRVALTGEPVRFEHYVEAFNRHFETFAYSPSAGKVACVFLDVTARKRAEYALRESQERLSMVVSSTELGTFDFEFQSGRLILSEFARRHFQLPPAVNVTAEMLLRRSCPEDGHRLKRMLQEVIQPQNGGYCATEFRTLDPESGKERWLFGRGRVFFDAQKRPLRAIGVTLDITERKRMEQERQELLAELHRQRSLLVSILNQMPAGVIVAEVPSGRILLTNDAMNRIFGKGVDYESGLNIFAQLNGIKKDGQAYSLQDWPIVRTVRTGESVVDEVFRIGQPDGSMRAVSASSTPIFNEQGKVVAGVGVTLDFTEKVRI